MVNNNDYLGISDESKIADVVENFSELFISEPIENNARINNS